MWAILLALLKCLPALLKIWAEKDKEKKQKKKEALKEVKDGIKNKDSSAITRGFDRINRM